MEYITSVFFYSILHCLLYHNSPHSSLWLQKDKETSVIGLLLYGVPQTAHLTLTNLIELMSLVIWHVT